MKEAAELDKIVEGQSGAMQAMQAMLRVNIKQDNSYKSNSSDLDTPTTPGSALAVRFFIGQHAHEEDTASAQSLDAGSYRSIKEATAHGSGQQGTGELQQKQKQTKKLQLQTADATDSNNTTPNTTGTATSLLQLPTPSSHELITQRNSTNGIASACSSPTLYGPHARRKSKSKSWRKARRGSGSEPAAEGVHIPPPPPLPPQPLATTSSSASLLSLRSNKIKRSSAVATSTAATPQIEEGGISANAEFATPPSYDVRYDGTASATTTMHDATNDKVSTQYLRKRQRGHIQLCVGKCDRKLVGRFVYFHPF